MKLDNCNLIYILDSIWKVVWKNIKKFVKLLNYEYIIFFYKSFWKISNNKKYKY